LPPSLDALVQGMTARAPEDRPQHAATVRDTLRGLALTPQASSHGLGAGLKSISARASALVSRAGTSVRVHRIVSRLRELGMGGWLRLRSLAAQRRNGSKSRTFWTEASALCGLMVLLLFWLILSDEEAPSANGSSPASIVAKLLPATLPDALVNAKRTMAEAKTSRERRAAAEVVLKFEPADRVPTTLRRIAELESARTCPTRKRALAHMRAEPDASYLAPVRRLEEAPRSGCGFLDLSDCYACIRTDLRETMSVLAPSGDRPSATRPAGR
jgi:hypothetical protein